MNLEFRIRAAVESDAAEICTMCVNTVREINIRDYSPEQVAKWSGRLEDTERMTKRLREQHSLLALSDQMVVGIVTWTDDGYLDLFYIHSEFQGKGCGSRLMEEMLQRSKAGGISSVYSDVSITARPFFRKYGFKTLQQQRVHIDQTEFVNYRMQLEIQRNTP